MGQLRLDNPLPFPSKEQAVIMPKHFITLPPTPKAPSTLLSAGIRLDTGLDSRIICSGVPYIAGWELLMTLEMICSSNRDTVFNNSEAYGGKVVFFFFSLNSLSILLIMRNRKS